MALLILNLSAAFRDTQLTRHSLQGIKSLAGFLYVMTPEWIATNFPSTVFFRDYMQSARALGYEVRHVEDSCGGFVVLTKHASPTQISFRCTSPTDGKIEIVLLDGGSSDTSQHVKEAFDPVTKHWFANHFELSGGYLRGLIQSWK